MADSELTVTVKVKGLEIAKALKVAMDALDNIAGYEPETNDVDTMTRSYGTCSDEASMALDEIAELLKDATIEMESDS